MSLRYQTVYPFTKTASRVKELYLGAFPENERFPFVLLEAASLWKGHAFKALYEDDQFVGLVYYCFNQEFFYLLFFAVSPDVQSQGYGGRIMADLKAKAEDRTFILMVEAMEEEADNAHQRKRRIAFYDRHGFSVTDYDYVERGDVYHVLANQPYFDPVRFEQFAKKAVFSAIPLAIKKRSS
ncbi:GNAT family N-acetyltransferase [Streptococcus sp. DD12]|uniref:GNAT family N-acetyltransferase n=1 Tax=Streptococcus sp. DD12 TaxID=1777880 RepID=UPI000794ECC0|nr:GNAT family N-acetyltransferase [Streptococcus sp. DD12]KXT76147.1 hypothetical protein STRDD12_00643 [Streptococcus sp. DD12]